MYSARRRVPGRRARRMLIEARDPTLAHYVDLQKRGEKVHRVYLIKEAVAWSRTRARADAAMTCAIMNDGDLPFGSSFEKILLLIQVGF